MTLPSPLVLGAIYGISEFCLALTRRSRERAASRDRHSLAVLWGVISVSVWLSISSVAWFPHAALPHRYSIWYLGRYFTVDVSIAAEQRVIDSGPYRFIRHPSYTGALIAFVGFGFCLSNWISILCVPCRLWARFCGASPLRSARLRRDLATTIASICERQNG